MRINKIEIENFKGFEHETFSFDSQITVLIGDNGTGKTSILDALSFTLGTFFLGVDGVSSRPLKQDEKRRVIVSPENIEIRLPFSIHVQHTLEGREYEWHRDTNKARGGSTSYRYASDLITSAKILTNKVREGEEVNLPLIAYYGSERLSSEKLQKKAYAKRGSRLDGYYSALDPRSFEQKFLLWFKTFEDSALKFYKDKTLYNAFTNTIASMVPGWKSVKFSWEANDMLGQLENGEWMPFNMLSGGYKNVVRLSADIAYRAIKLNPHLGGNAVTETNGVVLIDELDMHLHPKWQKTIVADLKRTFPCIQFIATSHSPFIIQSLIPNEIINMDGVIREDPSTKSIEEIAEDEMQIENVKRSKRFIEMQNLAAEYFNLIKKGKSSDDDTYTKGLKKRLDEIELEFSNDPVYIALMKSERATEMNK